MSNKGKIVIGMSGGVDSSVAAYLLKEQGYDVIGVTMQTWNEEACSNTTPEDKIGAGVIEDAGKVADLLSIPHFVINFEKEFKSCVKDYFVNEYLAGRTPNPCVVCNRYVKWEALLDRAKEYGADMIATGHYARIKRCENGRLAIAMAESKQKDQTYALFNLTQEQLGRTLMPLGEYHKDKIREIAASIGMNVAEKKDSQEICFIPDNDYASFIDREAFSRVMGPGNFVSADGTILGQHKGITHYTIGQRRGLNIAFGERTFVTEIRVNTNEVVLGGPNDVFTDRLEADHLNFMGFANISEPVKLLAKIRYSAKGSMCTVTRTAKEKIQCIFDEPVRAVTPGQAVVLYDGDYIAGGGIIL